VTPEHLVDHGWLVGSSRTMSDKLMEMYRDLGGFGTLLLFTFVYADDAEPWFKSIVLLAEQMLPYSISIPIAPRTTQARLTE
jgi:alkanesulfonate monooxygenase SsuD/methylene tetrahydromethanopterin reductase-like flavin-dependent oxidoreductase (luciferase family)